MCSWLTLLGLSGLWIRRGSWWRLGGASLIAAPLRDTGSWQYLGARNSKGFMGGLTGGRVCTGTHPEPTDRERSCRTGRGLVHGGEGASYEQCPGLSAGSGPLWRCVPPMCVPR